MEKRLTIPPMTMVQLQARNNGCVSTDICVQPTLHLRGAVMPHTIVSANSKVPVVIKNLSDNCISLPRNTEIGVGIEVEEVLGVEPDITPSKGG